LDRYIAGNLARGVGLVMAVLVSIFSLLEFLNQLDDVGKGDYHVLNAVWFVILIIPGLLVELLPVIALLGTLFALGWMAAHAELLSMQVAGVSALRIAGSVLKAGSGLLVLFVVLAEFIAPPGARLAQTERAMALAGGGNLSTGNAFWSRDGQRFINVGNVLHGRIPADIDIYTFGPGHRLKTFTHARRAQVHGRNQWILQGVTQKIYGSDGTIRRRFARLPWPSFLSKAQASALVLAPADLSLSDLYAYIQDLRVRGQNAALYALIFWQKISIPVATFAMTMLSIPFMFGSLRARSIALRLIEGAGIGLVFYLANQISGRLGLVLNFNPAFVALAPALIVLGIALWLFRRVR
jgi:lipopolysaccharide export system permease protein